MPALNTPIKYCKTSSLRANSFNANSIAVASTNISHESASIYETAARSFDTNITQNNYKVKTPSLIYSANNRNSYAETTTIRELYTDPIKRPLLSTQNSILALKPTVWKTDEKKSYIMQVCNKP